MAWGSGQSETSTACTPDSTKFPLQPLLLWFSATRMEKTATAKESTHLGVRAGLDLALHLNGVRAAVSGKYTEAENWKQPGALAGSLGPCQPTLQHALGAHSSSSCSGTDLHQIGGAISGGSGRVQLEGMEPPWI